MVTQRWPAMRKESAANEFTLFGEGALTNDQFKTMFLSVHAVVEGWQHTKRPGSDTSGLRAVAGALKCTASVKSASRDESNAAASARASAALCMGLRLHSEVRMNMVEACAHCCTGPDTYWSADSPSVPLLDIIGCLPSTQQNTIAAQLVGFARTA